MPELNDFSPVHNPTQPTRFLLYGRIVFDTADGFLASGRVSPQLLDGQLVNELDRCFVGVLRPLSPSYFIKLQYCDLLRPIA